MTQTAPTTPTSESASASASASSLVLAPDMSLAVAEGLLARVKLEAEVAGVLLAAAVVDRGGNLVASMRMDQAQLGAGSLAMDKAVTAISFGYPTGVWRDSSAPGGSDWGLAHTLGGRAIVFPGGMPVFYSSMIVGALGVSGAASDVDEACARNAVGAMGLDVAPVNAP